MSFIDTRVNQSASSTEVVVCNLMVTMRVRHWHVYVQKTYINIFKTHFGTMFSGVIQRMKSKLIDIGTP